MKKLTRLRSRGLILALTAATGVLLAFTWTGHVSAQAPAAAKPGTAGAAFKNVTTGPLKVLTVDDFMAAMGVISADLGLDCSDCHPGAGSDKVDWVFDTPLKKTARKMIEMVGAINKANFGGAQMVTCWTCHHGREIPGTTITLDKLYSAPNDEKDDIVLQGQGEPTGAQVIDKYIAALGGAQKVNALTSFIATGTSKGYEALGGGGRCELF